VGIDMIRKKAKDATRIADIKQISAAVENYFDSCYKFPSDIYNPQDGLTRDCNGNSYISEVPKDPNGDRYAYYAVTNPNEPQKFHVCAKLDLSFGGNKGKAGVAPFTEEGGLDTCDGEDQFTFDMVGGAYGL
jgi:hypothetical protein